MRADFDADTDTADAPVAILVLARSAIGRGWVARAVRVRPVAGCREGAETRPLRRLGLRATDCAARSQRTVLAARPRACVVADACCARVATAGGGLEAESALVGDQRKDAVGRTAREVARVRSGNVVILTDPHEKRGRALSCRPTVAIPGRGAVRVRLPVDIAGAAGARDHLVVDDAVTYRRNIFV